MKIKAAVVEEVGAPFEIKDNIDLHEVGPTDLQIIFSITSTLSWYTFQTVITCSI